MRLDHFKALLTGASPVEPDPLHTALTIEFDDLNARVVSDGVVGPSPQ